MEYPVFEQNDFEDLKLIKKKLQQVLKIGKEVPPLVRFANEYYFLCGDDFFVRMTTPENCEVMFHVFGDDDFRKKLS